MATSAVGSPGGCTCSLRRGWRIGACSVWGKRQFWGVMRGLEAPQYICGGHQEDRPRLFTVVHGGRTRDNRQKLRKEGFGLDVREDIFTIAQRGYDVSHLCMFSRVDWLKPRATWCGSIADPASGRTLDQRSPGVPSNRNCPMIL